VNNCRRRARRLRIGIGRLVAGLGDFLAEILEHRRCSTEEAVLYRGSSERMDLFRDVVLVLRQVLGQMGELISEQEAQSAYRAKSEHDHGDDGRHAAEVTPPEQQYRRRERKAQENCQGHGDKDFAPEVKRHNRDDANGQISNQIGRSACGENLDPVGADDRRSGIGHGGDIAPCGGVSVQRKLAAVRSRARARYSASD